MYAEIMAPFFPRTVRPVFPHYETNSADVSNSALLQLSSSILLKGISIALAIHSLDRRDESLLFL